MLYFFQLKHWSSFCYWFWWFLLYMLWLRSSSSTNSFKMTLKIFAVAPCLSVWLLSLCWGHCQTHHWEMWVLITCLLLKVFPPISFSQTQNIKTFSDNSFVTILRLLYSISFFVIVTTLGLNIVIAILVDNFSALREKKVIQRIRLNFKPAQIHVNFNTLLITLIL